MFGAESALVRSQIISGTHAITLSLFGVLRPGDELIYITGKPYDTLQSIVDGGEKDTGSLKDFDIQYRHIDLINDREIDWEGVRQAINEKTKKWLQSSAQKVMQSDLPLQLIKYVKCVKK